MSKLRAFLKRYQNLFRLRAYLARERGEFILAIVCGILNNVFNLGALLLGSYLTSLAFTGAPAERIKSLLLPLFALVLGKGLFQYLHMLICHDVAYKILADLRSDLYKAVERGEPALSLKYRTGEISSIVMEDVESLESFLAHIAGDYIIALVCMILFLSVFMVVSWPLALISLVASIILAVLPYTFGRINQRRGAELRKRLGETNAGVVETIQGLKEIIFFGREERQLAAIQSDTLALTGLELRDGFIKGAQAGLANFVLSVVLIAVLIGARQLVGLGALDPLYISLVVTLALNVFLPLATVSGTAGHLNVVAAAADRVYGLLQAEPALDPERKLAPKEAWLGTDEARLESGASVGRERTLTPEEKALAVAHPNPPLLAVRDLHFAYEPERPVLRGLNFDLEQGEALAISGGSGVGKSTLVNLILRFFDPDQGGIYLRGQNIRALEPEALRRQIAFVPQDVYLFRGTILDNLRLAAPEASLEQVQRACRIALADGFIEQAGGYEAFVGERGLTLSGGQKQRLAIARALLTEAPILVMDEAVSNLDSRSEELFREALRAISKERTLITIAHRRSTLMDASRLLLLEAGRIAYDGPPAGAPLFQMDQH